jgi:hypothetical protein
MTTKLIRLGLLHPERLDPATREELEQVVAALQAIVKATSDPSPSQQRSPADPAGTTSTTGVMLGLNGSITPTRTGRVLMALSGTLANATAIGDGAALQLRYGLGSPPANGAALAGTAVGGLAQYVASTTAQTVPVSLQALVSDLRLNTATWVDASLAALTGGTATVTGVSLTLLEV